MNVNSIADCELHEKYLRGASVPMLPARIALAPGPRQGQSQIRKAVHESFFFVRQFLQQSNGRQTKGKWKNFRKKGNFFPLFSGRIKRKIL
jgi:hypothetical protein